MEPEEGWYYIALVRSHDDCFLGGICLKGISQANVLETLADVVPSMELKLIRTVVIKFPENTPELPREFTHRFLCLEELEELECEMDRARLN